LAGTTPAEAALADMVVNGVMDARVPLITARFQSDPVAALNKFATTALPKLLGNLQNLLSSSSSSSSSPTSTYVAGGQSPTYADVMLFELVEYSLDELGRRGEDLLAKYPAVANVVQNMCEHPRLAVFLSSSRRKPTPNDAFVANVCDILAFPKPAYLG